MNITDKQVQGRNGGRRYSKKHELNQLFNAKNMRRTNIDN